MKRKLRDRILSLFLCVLTVFSCVPTSVFAETIDEEFIEHEDVSYYLFIDQKTEFGTITDYNEEKEYIDIYTEEASIEGSELPELPEDAELDEDFDLEEFIKSLEVFHKATDYFCHNQVNLQLNIEEGYELDKLFITELIPEEEISDEELVDEDIIDEDVADEDIVDENVDDIEEEIKPIEVEYIIDEDNVVTFEMPEFDVFVSATFKVKEIEPEDEEDQIADTEEEPEEPVIEEESSSYLVFIDQQTEYGSIADANAEKEYIDVFNEVEGEDEPTLLYKYSEYEVDSEVNLQLEIEEGYELVEIFVDKAIIEDEENISVEYTHDAETNIVSFIMPDFNVEVSASFKEIEVEPEQPIEGTDEEDPSYDCGNSGHKYEDVVTPPTCTEKGYTTHTCSVCEDSFADSEVEETGHSYVEVVTDPTCTEKGYTTHTCSVCEDSFTDNEVEETGHSYVEVVTDPTCTEKGYTTHTCSVCEDSYTDNEVEETGHSYVEVVTEPTCTEKGYTTHTCSVCEDSYTDNEVESLGHSYAEEITKEATETEEGVKTFTCSCGDTYTEAIPVIKKEPVKSPIKNPAPNISDMVAGDDDTIDVYIRELTTELFYGAEETDDGYVWTAPEYNNGHRFSYRINYAISGVDVAPENTIRLTIPKSILTTRDGERGDFYEMSIPSLSQVEAALNGTGESIDNDVNFAYYENGNELIIYNFRELPAGYNGYVELSYYTTETTYRYVDMAEQSPFTCTMSSPMNSMTAEPIPVKINTTAKITYTNKRYPVRYAEWDSNWGDAVKPENDENYYYLVWTIESNVTSTQPYTFTLSDSVVGNFEGMEVLGYRFSGQQTFGASNSIENQTTRYTRYDYVITSIPLDIYSAEEYWEATNTIIATVDPVDQIDEDTSSTDTEKWTWTKPVFTIPTGLVNVYKVADGSYRSNYYLSSAAHRAPSLDFEHSNYTRYDLESFSGYDGAEITNTELDGFKYASWIVGYPYPWTYDSSYNNPLNPSAYGKLPFKYELIDEGLQLTNDSNNANEFSDFLTSEDFRFESLGFSWLMKDAKFNDSEQKFEEIDVAYTPDDIITFYGKFGTSDEWVQFARYNLYTGEKTPNPNYVKEMSSSSIVFKNDVDMVAYKLETTNAHYFTELFTVPHLTLKSSQKVMDYVSDKPSIGILNNNSGNFYYATEETDGVPTVLLNTIETQDTEYARVSQRYSDIYKDIVSASNIPKKRVFSISWKVTQSETMEWGSGGERDYIPQNGGTFYDLLPEGAVFSKESVDVQIAYNQFLPSSAYKVTTIDNYKGTGRTMLIVKIDQTANSYVLYYDTIHPWNSIKDYGNDVYNPVAYETGNSSITKGFADNGGRFFADGTTNYNAIQDYVIMSELNPESETPTALKFIYAQKRYDIVAITSASSGLMKKVKAENDSDYSYETITNINGNYSYQLRYMNSYTSSSKNMIFFDSLENYDYDTMRNYGTLSDWRGTLQSIDLNQIKSKGIAPVVYYSAVEKLDIEENNDLSDSSVWNILTEDTDLSTVKAIAIDMRKSTNGEDFVLRAGDSVVATLHMKAPSNCPEIENGYAYTYNNIYIQDTVMDASGAGGQDFLIHQDYTAVRLVVTGNFGVEKVSTETSEIKIEGIEFRLFGTSSYGTEIDEIISTDASGRVYFDKIERGSYVLQEYKSTDDWVLDITERYVTIDDEGKVWIDGQDYTDAYITISNRPRIHGDFEFFKKEFGDDFISVPNTTFRLEGVSDYGLPVLIYGTSNAGGVVSLKNIEMGTYKLTEVEANPNYKLSNITYTLKVDNLGNAEIIGSDEVNEDGNPVSLDDSQWFKKENGKVTIYNLFNSTEFRLRKVDDSNHSIFLEGAEFSMIGTSDDGVSVNIKATSDRNGCVAFLNVSPGVYVLRETKAPTNVDENGELGGDLNYLLSETEYIVEIDWLGNVTINGLEVEEETGYFKITNKRAYDKEIVITKIWKDGLTSEERIAQGIIPKLHLTNRDLSKDANFRAHVWETTKVLSNSTCMENGEVIQVCADCGIETTAKLPLLEHDWIEDSATDSTCSTRGEKMYHCSVDGCGTTKKEPLDLAPHEFVNGICLNCSLELLYQGIVMDDVGTAEVAVSVNNFDYNDTSQMPYYSKIITFIPKTSGTYIFKSTANESINAFGRIYSSDMKSLVFDDNTAGNGQFEITYNCRAGEIYYFAIGGYMNENEILTIPVTIHLKT